MKCILMNKNMPIAELELDDIDEERIEVLSKAITGRVEELQEMELEQKKQFTLGSLRTGDKE